LANGTIEKSGRVKKKLGLGEKKKGEKKKGKKRKEKGA